MIKSIILHGIDGGVILSMILLGIFVPSMLFIIGLLKLRKNKKKAKIILIIAAVYSIISFGVCGGFGL